jgi:hypothetical protein
MLLGEPLRQQDQCGACGCIIDGKERFQEIKAIAGDGVMLKHRIKCSHLSCGGCTATGSIAPGGLQRHDIIAYAATIEGPLSLDLATRHNA